MVLSAFADTRSLTERPSASEIMVTLSRLGRKRRLVLMLEWLTLCPTCAPLPVSSHRHDIEKPCLYKAFAGSSLYALSAARAPAPSQAGGPIVSACKSVKARGPGPVRHP